jgi:hypothetical protein
LTDLQVLDVEGVFLRVPIMPIRGIVVEAKVEDLERYLPRFMVDVKNDGNADGIKPRVALVAVCSYFPSLRMISEIEGSTARDG